MKSRPNLLIFMTDQQRAETVLRGHRLKAITPRMDAFQATAVTFARAYATSPHCCPSRASFYTGLYPSQHGVWHNVNVANAITRGPRENVPFWSRSLDEAGYHLFFSGKWHVSNSQPPSDFGWRELYPEFSQTHLSPEAQKKAARDWEVRFLRENTVNTLPDHRRPSEILRPGLPPYLHYGTQENPFDDETTVDRAVDFLYQDLKPGGAPWVLYVGTLGPHDPYTPPQRFLDLYRDIEIDLPPSFYDTLADKPNLYRRTRDRFDQLTEEEHKEALRHYLAFCSYEDYLFGRLLDALAESGEADNTAVLYLSDHGDYAGDHGLWCKGLPSFESAYHIPAVMKVPGMPKTAEGRMIDAPISLVDFAPTFLELASLPPEDRVAGKSLMPWLRGETPTEWRDALFFQSDGNEIYGIQRIITTDEWKLVFNEFDYDELYHLSEDREEMINLLAPPPAVRRTGVHPFASIPAELRDVVRDLYTRLWQFSLAHDDHLVNAYIMTALATYGPGLGL